MSKLKELVICGGVLWLGILAFDAWSKWRNLTAIAQTKMELICYQGASTNFFGKFGRWPTSATEFVSNSMGLVFIAPPLQALDGWGRQIVYEPFTTNTGFGRVVSYGRDGRPGGKGADADIEYRFR